MRRLLHVVPYYYPAIRYGGPIRSVHGLCTGLAGAGNKVEVLTTNVDGSGVSEVPLDRTVEIDGVHVRYFPVGLGRRLYRSPAMAHALAEAVPRADLVHIHAVYLWPGWAAARAADKAGVPYIVSPRGMLVRELIQRKSALAKRAWIALVERRTLARAAAIHVTSEGEAAAIRELGLDLAPIFIVPNGVDLPAAIPQRAEAENRGKERILYLGRISWKKGLDRLIRAMAEVPNATLDLAGNDEEGIRPKLEALAREQGVAERVRFLGPVEGERKWALLASADLLVLPSLNENFGIVVLEALGVGTPVVASEGVGAASIVADYNLGAVVPGTPAMLASAIHSLLTNPDHRRAMGERGQKIVQRDYSWAAIAPRMNAIYERILRESAHIGAPSRASTTNGLSSRVN